MLTYRHLNGSSQCIKPVSASPTQTHPAPWNYNFPHTLQPSGKPNEGVDESPPLSPLLRVIPLPGHLSFTGQWTANGPWVLVTVEKHKEIGSLGPTSGQCYVSGQSPGGGEVREGLVLGLELRWAETPASCHPHASPSGKGNYVSPF